ncbi:MAG TPA: MFS transporter [Opitutaceae bacterium]|nr:MFS transporter [Opitutaceae bacterium]
MKLKWFKSNVPEKDRVPFWQKVAYGLGGPVEGTAVWIPQTNVTPVFNIGLGMSPALVGLALTLWRAWDGIGNIIMGHVSDNARTRWGRRRPFIVVGAVLTGLTLPLLWWAPRGWGTWPLFAWLLGSGLVFYSCFTVWSTPYYSLQLEMTPDYDERTNITAYRAIFQAVLNLFASWIIALATLPLFSSFADKRPDLVSGMRYISIPLAVVTIVLGLLPGLFVQEPFYATDASKQPKQKLIPSLKQTITTKPFLVLLAIVLTKLLSYMLVGTLGFYVNAYYVCRGDIALAAKIEGLRGTLLVAPNLVAIPLCTWLSTRLSKISLLYTVASVGLVGYLSMYIFYTPAHPWLQVIPSLLISPLGVGLWLVAPAMQADIADYDELKTGLRREGSFAAVFSWMTKVVSTVASALGGLLLVWTGFNVTQGAKQPEHVLQNLRHLYILIPVGFLIVNVFTIRFYSLSRERMAEIRRELEARRGAV